MFIFSAVKVYIEEIVFVPDFFGLIYCSLRVTLVVRVSVISEKKKLLKGKGKDFQTCGFI